MNAATTRAIADFVVEYFQAGYPEGDGLASAIEHRWPDADQEDVMFAMYMVANLARTRPDAFPDLAKLEWVKMLNRASAANADELERRLMANRAGGKVPRRMKKVIVVLSACAYAVFLLIGFPLAVAWGTMALFPGVSPVVVAWVAIGALCVAGVMTSNSRWMKRVEEWSERWWPL